MFRTYILRALFCCFATGALANTTTERSVANFYHGKTIRIIVGYGAGGGYDLYARLVAQFLPTHLPGDPQAIVQNMPGGGSFVAAQYLSAVAPKDGTYLGSLAQTLALDSVVNSQYNLDVTKLAYIGRVTSNIDLGIASKRSGVTSFDDVRKKSFSVGASAGGSTSALYPAALNAYAGSKFRLVKGYEGTSDILLAMERGEVDITGAYGLPGMLISHPDWLHGGEVALIYQASTKRDKLLSAVPTLPELAKDDIGRQVLYAIASTGDIGRSILTTPGVPPERLAALKEAFQAMLRDPKFLAAAAARRLMVDPATGEQMDDLARQTANLSPDVRNRISKLVK